MVYLISKAETYRADSEAEAKKLIEKSSHNPDYTLTKYGSVYKEKKSNGEVEDSWYRVTLTKEYNNEKEPSAFTMVDLDAEED